MLFVRGTPSPRPAVFQPIPSITLLLLLLLLHSPSATYACTSIIVGAGASSDASIYIARNDDTGDARSTVNNLARHPARSRPALFRSNRNALQVELPAPGLAYTALPAVPADPAAGRNASGEEAGVNSAGVAISATETIFNCAAALAADPMLPATGLLEDAIPSLLLPQATSARHGVQLLGRLIARHGAGEGFGVLFADGRESWYLETASGHHWLAQRVPDDSFFVSANQGRFQECNLSDTANVIASPGLLQFAIQAGLYKPSAGGGKPLNFFAAFMADGPMDATYNRPRVHALQRLFAGMEGSSDGSPGSSAGGAAASGGRSGSGSATGSASTSGVTDASGTDTASASQGSGSQPPVFLRPSRPLGLADVAAGLRNHFDGSQHDAYLHRRPGESYRPVALLRTSMGHITRLRPAGPAARLAAGAAAAVPVAAADATTNTSSRASARVGASASTGTRASVSASTTTGTDNSAGAIAGQPLPDGLTVIQYVAMGMPALSPFVPIYKGLPGSALLPQLTTAGSEPEGSGGKSLFWRARRLQALVFRDWPGLAPAATSAIRAFEAQVESVQRPAMEQRYIRAVQQGDMRTAQQELAAFTAAVVQQACRLLEQLASRAAAQLGLPGVPPDAQLVGWLDAAAAAYAFHPPMQQQQKQAAAAGSANRQQQHVALPDSPLQLHIQASASA